MPTKQKNAAFAYSALLLSAFIITGFYILITSSFERYVTAAITSSTQASNAAITRLFVNEVYPELQTDLALTSDPRRVKDQLSANEIEHVDRRVREFMLGTDVLKAKFYNINGTTVYSSDAAQIGDDESGETGFETALTGTPVSEITYRGEFSSLDGDVFNRDLVASYIPIYGSNNEIIGVAELYTDRSGVIKHSEQLATRLEIELLPLLASMLFAFALVIWRFQVLITKIRIQSLDLSTRKN
jgi:hypothetical protein